MGAEAKRYLQEHAIPQLFELSPVKMLSNKTFKFKRSVHLIYAKIFWEDSESASSLITGLICNKPEDPIGFLESSLNKVRQNPNFEYKWDSFIDEKMLRKYEEPTKSGGPGGGKTRHAARVQEVLSKFGLVHICMPDMIRAAISKYQNTDSDWKEAAQRYQRGELIPNNLALGLVKAEMCNHQNAKAFFLEGFPREARQVESFEREVRPVNMAMILDYDENTLRHHMESRGLDMEVIDAKIREFKLKTLPSAKYFDDQRLLHLIPGEQTDQWIFERMKLLIQRAMELGIPVTTSKVASRVGSPMQRPDAVMLQFLEIASATQVTAVAETVSAVAEASENGSRTKTNGRATSVSNSSMATMNTRNATTSAPERPKPEAASEISMKEKPLTASKRKSPCKRNSVNESKSGKTRTDSMKEVDDIEAHERSRITKATSAKEVPDLERSSLSSKQSSISDTKMMPRKVIRTTSQTSKSSEMSHRSVHSVKSENQSVYSMKSGSKFYPTLIQYCSTILIDCESQAYWNFRIKRSAVNNRFPIGLPNKASVIVIAASQNLSLSQQIFTISTITVLWFTKYENFTIINSKWALQDLIKRKFQISIAKKYDGFLYISMGDLLRKEIDVNADDQLWQRIGKKINAGEPVPTKICRELLYSKIYDTDNICSGYVIEGYPRAKNQAIDFENQIGRLDLVILIDCTEEYCIETIQKRKKEGMTVRPDDSTKIINARLQMFKQNTLPMLKYFDDKGNLKWYVDGDSNIDKIFDEIVEVINNVIFTEERKDEKQQLSEALRKKDGEQ
ncbi:Adenylate kinase isoenzyme 5 [Dirofilaria immitis]|nr:Adenylate kinase isoenzyme 5 [Dirofilaria immitis]